MPPFAYIYLYAFLLPPLHNAIKQSTTAERYRLAEEDSGGERGLARGGPGDIGACRGDGGVFQAARKGAIGQRQSLGPGAVDGDKANTGVSTSRFPAALPAGC